MLIVLSALNDCLRPLAVICYASACYHAAAVQVRYRYEWWWWWWVDL